MKPAPVKITRPNPATGEIEVEVVPAESISPPKLPSRPKNGDPHAWRDFWGAHSECLTKEERRKVADGRTQASLRPLEYKPAWQKGDVLDVASGITAEVVKIAWSREGYVTHLRVIDHRPLYMARTMGGAGVPLVDENGYPVEYSDDVKEAARFDGAYTSSAAQGMIDAGEVLDPDLHRLHPDAPAANAVKRGRHRTTVDLARLEGRLCEARRKHWATGHIERQIERLRTKGAA